MADFVIEDIKERDLIGLLEHAHAHVPKHKGHTAWPALVLGLGAGQPPNSMSPCSFTARAACGLRIGLASSPTSCVLLLTCGTLGPLKGRPLSSIDCGRRDLFATGPGPDFGGAMPGKEKRPQVPEKSGMAADAVPLLACAAGAAASCAKAGNAAAAKIAKDRKFRCPRIPNSHL
jgi:hypothetical protein